MEFNCKALLSPIAKIEDVIKIAAILHGVEKKIKMLTDEYFKINLEHGIKIKPFTVPIFLNDPDRDGWCSDYIGAGLETTITSQSVGNNITLSSHFSLSFHANSRGDLLYEAWGTPKNIALGIRLVEILGGTLSMSNQTHDIFLNEQPIFKKEWTDDEKYYQEKQIFLFNLFPITIAQLRKAREISAIPVNSGEFDDCLKHYELYNSCSIHQKLNYELSLKKDGSIQKI